MAAQRFLAFIGGRLKQVAATIASAGAADDGKLVGLDASGRLDPTVMPTGVGAQTKIVTSSEILAAGDLINLHISSGDKVRKADATAEGKEVHGFVLAGFGNGASATIYLGGTMTGLSGLVAGTRYYLSASTPGALTATPPATAGNVVQFVGIAISATELDFDPADPVTLA